MESPASVSLKWAINAFLRDAVHYAEGTVSNARSVLNQLCGVIGDRPVSAVGRTEVRTYFYGGPGWVGLRARVRPGTFNRHRTICKVFFDYCAFREWVATNPITTHSVRKEQAPASPKLFLTPRQMHEALETRTYARDRAVLALMMNTALRAKEIQSLRVGDVDLDRGVIRVKIVKGNKTDEMPITEHLDAELRRWLTFYTEDVGAMHSTTCNQLLGKHRTCGPRDHARPLCRDWYLVPAKTRLFFAPGQERKPPKLKPETPYGKVRDSCNRALEEMGLRVRDESGRVVAGRGTGGHTWRRSTAQIGFDVFAQERNNPAEALMITSRLLHHSSVSTTQRYLNMDHYTAQRDEVLRGSGLVPLPDSSNIASLVREA